MFNINIQSKVSKIFVSILLTLLVLGNSLFMLHSFSHHKITSNKIPSLNTEVLHQSFFEKLIFAHKQYPTKKSGHCFLCVAANFQDQISLTSNLIFVATIFYLVFLLRYFNYPKFSYLLSSKPPRAPPFIS